MSDADSKLQIRPPQLRRWSAAILPLLLLAASPCAQGKSEYQTIMCRVKEIRDDPMVAQRSRDRAKNFEAENGHKGATGKTRWDGGWGIKKDKDGKVTGATIGRTTADCPSKTYPSPPDESKKGWGDKQLIAIHKEWKKILEDMAGATGCVAIDLIISTLIHEHVHTGQTYKYPYQGATQKERDKAEAKVELPAYCAQIEFLCDLLGTDKYQPSGIPASPNPDREVLEKFKKGKQNQKEEWQKKKNC